MLRPANIRKQLRPNRVGMAQLFDSYFQPIGARCIGKRRIVAILLFLSASAAMLGVSGCKSSAVSVSSVTISPSSATVSLGGQTDFTATVNLNNSSSTTIATTTTVTWEVNGTVGGSTSVGTIVSSSTDNEVGVYTAPLTVPPTNNGTVNITAVAQQTGTTSTSTNTASTITSNTAVVTVSPILGFSISPTITTIAAGATVQFSATLNGIADGNATWSVTSANGTTGAGSIGPTTGIYVAPLLPPPGNSVTITGQDGTNSQSETVTIAYSDHSLSGPYAFSYSGDNQLGFYAVAGSFVADGNGNIESGEEDMDSFSTGVSTQVPIVGGYIVNADGRGSIYLNNGTINLHFVLTSNQHALILRSDLQNTGSGTIDQQNLSALTGSDSALSGPYVFNGSGSSTGFAPLALAGEFSADGAGNIPVTNTILDVNANGTVTQADRSLTGSYAFTSNPSGAGRGTLTLTSTTTGTRLYAFYVIDGTRFHFVEIDTAAYLAGDGFSALAGSGFTTSSLASGNYVFTAGGNSSSGAYASGGVFTSNGAGTVSGGAFDANNAGTVQTNATLTSCAYSVDGLTGRIDLRLCGAGTTEYAMYQTSQNSALLLQLDPTATTKGIAYQQQGSSAVPSANLGFSLAGQGIFHNTPSAYEEDVEGQFTSSGTGVTAGNIDINTFNEPFLNDPINIGTTTTTNGTTTVVTTISAATANGRGTAVIVGTNPLVTYDLVYYLINANSALLFDSDKTFVLTGILNLQF